MAQDVGTVYVKVLPSGQGFGKSLEGQVDSAVKAGSKTGFGDLVSKAGGAFGKIGKIGLGAVTAIGTGIAGLAGKGGFDRALNIERAQSKLAGLGHDASSVQAIMDDALKSVRGTAFGLGDAASVAASLSAAGVKSGAQLENVLKTVADTAQISGRSLTDIGTIYGSVAARGKLQGDDMLQLMSSGIPVLAMLGKHLGKTSAEVSEMVSKGKIDFQTFADAMQEGMGGAALKAGETFDGALANTKASLSRLGEKFMNPVLENARNLFNAAIPAVDGFTNAIAPLSEQFGGTLSSAMDGVIAKIGEFSKGLEDGTITLDDIKRRVGEIAGGFAAISFAGPALSNISSLDGIFGNLDKIPSQISGKKKPILDALDKVRGDMGARASLFGEGLSPITDKVTSFFEPVTSRISSFGSKIGGAFSTAGSKIMSGASTIGGKIAAPFQTLGGKIGGFLSPVTSRISSFGSTITGALGDAFGGAFMGVGGKIQSLGGDILGKFTSLFSPGRFLKILSFGTVAAGLVAGLGAVVSQGGAEMLGQITELAGQLPGMITGFIDQLLANLPQFISTGSEVIQTLLQAIVTAAPTLLQGAAQVILTLVTGLSQQLPTLIPMAIQLITTIIMGLIQALPLLLEAGLQLIMGLAQGLIQALPTLLEALPQIITALIEFLVSALPQILEMGVQLLIMLVNGIVTAIPQLMAMLPTIINTVVDTLISNLPMIINTGIQLLIALINGLVNALPQLMGMVPQIISTIVSTLASNFPRLVSAGMDAIVQLITGLGKSFPQIMSKMKEVPGIIVGAIGDAGKMLWESGTKIIGGLIDGIGSMFSKAKDAVSGFLGGIRNLLPFSPAKEGPFSGKGWTLYSGRSIAEALADGIQDKANLVSKAVDSTLSQAHARIVDSSAISRAFSQSLSDGWDTARLGDGLTGQLVADSAYRAAIDLRDSQTADVVGELRSLRREMPGFIADYTPVMSARDLARVR
ncbi:tape measure protein [Arcanobacterium haemolyticum]|nr:tape measure protein [Arcanobacterium haemolyticum]